MGLFNHKEPCKKCRTLTRSKDENGRPLCPECQEANEKEKIRSLIENRIQNQIRNRKTHICSNCNTEMKKVSYPDLDSLIELEYDNEEEQEFVVIDECTCCGAVLLERQQLKEIADLIEEDCYEDENGYNFGNAFLIAMAEK